MQGTRFSNKNSGKSPDYLDVNRTRITSALSEYLADLNRCQQRLSKEQEAALAARAREGDPGAVESLFSAHMAQVVSIAKRFHSLNVWAPIEDLVQAGNIGLLGAIRRFDPKIARLSTYCHRGITFQIIRELQRLTHVRGREFSPDSNPAYEEYFNEEATGNVLRLSEIPGKLPEPDCAVRDLEESDLKAAIILEILRFVQRRGGRLLFVLLCRCTGHTLEQTGEKLGVSKERVRQLEKRTLNLIRAEFAEHAEVLMDPDSVPGPVVEKVLRELTEAGPVVSHYRSTLQTAHE